MRTGELRVVTALPSDTADYRGQNTRLLTLIRETVERLDNLDAKTKRTTISELKADIRTLANWLEVESQIAASY